MFATTYRLYCDHGLQWRQFTLRILRVACPLLTLGFCRYQIMLLGACERSWSPVYTIQPVVKPVVKQVWQPVVSCIQTFNRLSNSFHNWFNKTAVSCIQPVVKTVVQPGLTTVLNEQTGCQTVDKHGLTTGCIVYTNIQPVVNPVVKPVWQPVVSCKRGLTVKPVSVVLHKLESELSCCIPVYSKFLYCAGCGFQPCRLNSPTFFNTLHRCSC